MALLSTLLSPRCPPGGCLSPLAAASPQQGEDSSPPLPSPPSPGFWVVLGDFGLYFSPICLVGAKGINKRSKQSWPVTHVPSWEQTPRAPLPQGPGPGKDSGGLQ